MSAAVRVLQKRNRVGDTYWLPAWLMIKNWLTWLQRLASPKTCRVSHLQHPLQDGVWRPETQESWGYRSGLKCSRLQVQKGPRFHLSLRPEESQCPQFEGSQEGGILQISHFLLVFLFSLHLLAQGLPTSQRAICFTKSTDLISSKNSLMETPGLCFTQCLGPLWPSQADT